MGPSETVCSWWKGDRNVKFCSKKTAPDNQNGPCPPPPVSLPRPTPFPAPSLWWALVNFEPNISRIYTRQLKSWVSLLRSTPLKMERIESSETSTLNAQTPGDYQKKHNTAFNTRRKFEIKNPYISFRKWTWKMNNFWDKIFQHSSGMLVMVNNYSIPINVIRDTDNVLKYIT